MNKVLFIDRDGTIIFEPEDKKIDSLEKLELEPNVIPALRKLASAGFVFVMVSNQDGLGSEGFSLESFEAPQQKLLDLLKSQGIVFESIKICPHFSTESCECRKPKVGLVMDYIRDRKFDLNNSYMIGDRATDLEFAKNIGIAGLLYDRSQDWLVLADSIIFKERKASVTRVTNETNINVSVNLDNEGQIVIQTGLGFFDHMLEQLTKHAGISINLKVSGDLNVDEHHTVEDTALALGEALRQALGDKGGIQRYGFLLPMDEALATIALDVSGRPYCAFKGIFNREKIGDLPIELVSHFFQSLAVGLGACLQVQVSGENTHHMVESVFKGVGRALRMAFRKEGVSLPSTKGVL